MADRDLTGVLLVGGASSRFGSAKALATFRGETLAERGWRTLGEVCSERFALGKVHQDLRLPFPVVDDGFEIQAPIAGVVAGLRLAAYELVAFLPVDTPLVTGAVLRALASVCRDAAVPQTGPLPGVYARSALRRLEERLAAGRLSLRRALDELDAVEAQVDETVLVNVNTPEDLAALSFVV